MPGSQDRIRDLELKLQQLDAESGHIIGSSFVELDCNNGNGSKKITFQEIWEMAVPQL